MLYAEDLREDGDIFAVTFTVLAADSGDNTVSGGR